MSQLFTPIRLRELSLDNRIVVSPMCQYSAQDGSAQEWHLIHLGGLAQSGAGLLFLEATAVAPEGRITPTCLGLYSDANEAALARVVADIRKWSQMPLGIQLGHAGRKGVKLRTVEWRRPHTASLRGLAAGGALGGCHIRPRAAAGDAGWNRNWTHPRRICLLGQACRPDRTRRHGTALCTWLPGA